MTSLKVAASGDYVPTINFNHPSKHNGVNYMPQKVSACRDCLT